MNLTENTDHCFEEILRGINLLSSQITGKYLQELKAEEECLHDLDTIGEGNSKEPI